MGRRIIDLSHSIHEGMMSYPTHWHPIVEITQLGRFGIENRETRKILMGTHTGTHLDAPRHFIQGGMTVEQIPLELLAGPAVVLNFAPAEPYQEIGVNDLEAKLKGRKPERLVLRFDWSDYFGDMKFYRENPYLTEEASQWLVDNGVKLLAMDSATPDDPRLGPNNPPDSPNHKILLGANVILLEYLTNLKQLTSDEIELIVMPLKIDGADGAPVRCVAIED